MAPTVVPAPVVAVSVRGAVALPGVYEFSEGARVQEAVDRAGGATAAADLSDINLAARLMDGTTLTVPETPDPKEHFGARQATPMNPTAYTITGWQPTAASAPAGSAGTDAAGAKSGTLDLNSASEAELQALPGIGPKLAMQIVQYRAGTRFSCLEDLLNVSGIGPKRLETLRPFVSVR
jgi:competence protein ComEA